ncbi:MAG TPA: molybdopterin synthase sulfur carrier subunit [Gammaproteobacteria bacterium]|nr:molybdopterin synthase sulfur carrier subunit [Gammaproteobacteria bacterium]
MSITIKLFSALREALGESEFELAISDISEASEQVDVAAIKVLLSQRGAAWKEALNQPNLVHALNHKVVFTDAMVSEGDELAFFPPMTGG